MTPGEYLISRGYSPSNIAEEQVHMLYPGLTNVDDVCTIDIEETSVAWVCRSASGQPIGVQTRPIGEKRYRWYQAKDATHLPIIYGEESDYEILFRERKMILTEGAFDRRAVKSCLPERAVFGRLSKGAANQLRYFILRYAKVLWLVFDMDLPGRQAAEKAENKLGDDLDVYTMVYPAKDPADLVVRVGLQRAEEMFRAQIDTQEF